MFREVFDCISRGNSLIGLSTDYEYNPFLSKTFYQSAWLHCVVSRHSWTSKTDSKFIQTGRNRIGKMFHIGKGKNNNWKRQIFMNAVTANADVMQ